MVVSLRARRLPGSVDSSRRRERAGARRTPRSVVKERQALLALKAAEDRHGRMRLAQGLVELVGLDLDGAPCEHRATVGAAPFADVRLIAAVHDARHLRPDAHRQAHRTGGVRAVEHGARAQMPMSLAERRLAQAVELGVSGGIAVGDDLVPGGGHDLVVADENGAERVVAALLRYTRHADRLFHPPRIRVARWKRSRLDTHDSSSSGHFTAPAVVSRHSGGSVW